MTKPDVVNAVVEGAEINKVQAERAIESFIDFVKTTLQSGEKLTLKGFGSFSVKKSKERVGRNPKTGESVKITAKTSPKFAPGKEFKAFVNSGTK